MQINRRDLFRSSLAIGGAAALAGAGGLSVEAVAGSPAVHRAALGTTTRKVTLLRGHADASGYHKVVTAPGEGKGIVRTLGAKAGPGRARNRRHLVSFAHLSDIHIVDSQSPMRLVYDDRISDNLSNTTFRSCWRPQEILTAQIAEAMVREINAVGRGPVLGKKLGFAIQTGDNSDNNQLNEIQWNIRILEGGPIQPDSGDLTKYEGVMDNDPTSYDPAYWHPEPTPAGLTDDNAKTEHGFPTVEGLLDAARAPFQAEGLDVPWYTAHGNHDGLVQGNFAPRPEDKALAIGNKLQWNANSFRTVTADKNRKMVSTKEWVLQHFANAAARPAGHGFTATNKTKGTAYYTFVKGGIRFVVLDTCNPNGRDTGSLDRPQFAWLKKTLRASATKPVILASHHPIASMTNTTVGPHDTLPPVNADELLTELLKHECVIAWVNGHTHNNHIWSHSRKGAPGRFWEINTASHIDWPQQSRIVEVANNHDGTLSIFTTMLDHGAPLEFSGDPADLSDPMQLAALGRELAANDWQEVDERRRGPRNARNVELVLRAPKFMR